MTRNGRTDYSFKLCPRAPFCTPASSSLPSRSAFERHRNQMSAPHQVRPTSLLSPQFVTGVYIPSGLVLASVGLVKPQWLPYAIAVSLILGAWRIYSVGRHSWQSGPAAVVKSFADSVAQTQRLRKHQSQRRMRYRKKL